MKPTYEKKWLKSQGYCEQNCCANCANIVKHHNVIGYSCRRDPSGWADDVETVKPWGKCEHWEKKD